MLKRRGYFSVYLRQLQKSCQGTWGEAWGPAAPGSGQWLRACRRAPPRTRKGLPAGAVLSAAPVRRSAGAPAPRPAPDESSFKLRTGAPPAAGRRLVARPILIGRSPCSSAVTPRSPAGVPPSSESPENNFKMAATAARKTMGSGRRGQAEA